MTATLIGSQFGDEGKGGMVDVFSGDADIVVRYQGGDNAGHTVVHEGEEYKLRLIPSGVVRGTVGVLARGCVVNLITLFDELDGLRDRGLDPDIRIDGRAHIVLPYHRLLDRAKDAARATKVGTTGNGIGPAYEDKAARSGIRVADLLHPHQLRERLEATIPRKRRLAEGVFDIDESEPFDTEALLDQLRTFGDRLTSEEMVIDAGAYLTTKKRGGQTILFEGAQGTHIDLDHGNYPFVTSSNPTTGGAITGTGVPPTMITDGAIIGVVKSYLSRVGGGPMPTEMAKSPATAIREKVGEFGTVTGRPRRIGWLDLPMLRHATRVNGYTGLTLNHVDALGGLKEIRICEAYELDGERSTEIPATTTEWERCTPQYRTFEPWADLDWTEVAISGYDTLPANACAYVEYVSDQLEVPVYALSIGPARAETIILENPLIE